MVLFVYVLALVLLVCVWVFGDVGGRVKLILTLVYEVLPKTWAPG